MSAPAQNPKTIPVSQIHTGMRGVAYTVFEGVKPEAMDVEVLGVLHNVNGPKGDVILVRLHGEKVEYTGVVAGMSGSPVYLEGRLAGALAFQLIVGLYGGYFGAGIGILMLAALSIIGLTDIHEMNGLKNVLALCINGVAALYFISMGMVMWREVVVMAIGAIAGGFGGAGIARRTGRRAVRWAEHRDDGGDREHDDDCRVDNRVPGIDSHRGVSEDAFERPRSDQREPGACSETNADRRCS